jgi:hypothetical protein
LRKRLIGAVSDAARAADPTAVAAGGDIHSVGMVLLRSKPKNANAARRIVINEIPVEGRRGA